ncbi:MAG TPA: hypothetical protein V6C97_19640 [Oculatellaceae cyanobacterium]
MVKDHGDGTIKTPTQSNAGCEAGFHHELQQMHHSHLLHNRKAHHETSATDCIPNLTIENNSLVADEDQNPNKLLARMALDGTLPTKQAATATDQNFSLVADEDLNYSKILARKALYGQQPAGETTSAPDKYDSLLADEDRSYNRTLAEMAINGLLPNKYAINTSADANSSFSAFESLNLDIHAQKSPYTAFEAQDRDEHRPENKWQPMLHSHNHWFHWFHK